MRLWIATFFFLVLSGHLVFAQHAGHEMPPAKERTPAMRQADKQRDVYYCPMHPAYTSDRPGDCPICNMKLVKKAAAPAAVEEAEETGGSGVYIGPQKQQLIGVRTDKVIYRPLNKIIRTVGRVAFDPQLYVAQQEYIEAVKTSEFLKDSAQREIAGRMAALVAAAELKLKLQGLDITQIEELRKTKENDQSLLLASAEAGFIWVYAVIYEYELEWVRPGLEAVVTAAAYPGKEWTGRIAALDPVFDAQTRSVRARIKAGNPDGLLQPDMYVDVQISSGLGAHLAVPKEAILDSGLRKIVFLAQGAGHFQPREIRTGVATDEYAQVLEGLLEGDEVVVSGNFLIDSESRLKAALGEAAGHQH